MKLRLPRQQTGWFLCQLCPPQVIQESHSDVPGAQLGRSKPQTVFHKEEPRKGFHLHLFNIVFLVQYLSRIFSVSFQNKSVPIPFLPLY